ncbi:MAG: multidrug effflux MFS transporter [Rhodobacteraceae bacterium]|nr:multidrug effflux MFS transporter [Paracoccaceae bacterium]
MHPRPIVRFLDRTTPPHIITLILLTGLATLSMNVFLPSLPNMTAWFDTDYKVMQLSVALYLAVNGLLQLFVGPLSDRYGRRPVILGGCVLFTLATVGTLLAPNVETFLFFRMCQAVIVTALVLARAVVRDMVPEAQAASMLGYVTMGMAVVPMVGPAIGGLLDEAFGWQASFIFLLLCGIAVTLLAWADLGETAANRGGRFRDQVRDYPILFRSRRFWGYCLTAAFAGGAFFAFLGGAPYVGTEYFGLTPGQLGLYFMPTALGYLVGNFLSGRFSMQLGIAPMALSGAAIMGLGMAASFVLLASGVFHPASFFGLCFFVGVGNGAVLPNAMAAMLSVRPQLAGTAAGLGGASMLGGGAGVSTLAGALLAPDTGPYPLIVLMMVCSVLAFLTLVVTNRLTPRG